MKILITGMTSSQTNEFARTGARNFAGIIAHTLRALGHDAVVDKVDLSSWEDGPLDEYDLCFVGIGPLKGMGTAYKYGALYALATKPCVPFFDDLDVRKVHRELVTCNVKNSELFKELWRYKKDWSVVSESSKLRKLLLSPLNDLITGEKYPNALAPGWNRDSVFRKIVKMNRRWADITLAVDGSRVVLPDDFETHTWDPGARETWVTCWPLDSKAVKRSGAFAWEIERFNRVSWDNLYTSSGLLIPASGWAPEVAAAVHSGIPVAGAWKTLSTELGPSFEALPYSIEEMPLEERHKHASKQKEDFLRNSTEIDHLRDTIKKIVSDTRH